MAERGMTVFEFINSCIRQFGKLLNLGHSFFQLLIAGSTPEVAAITMMTKAGATLLNAVVADVIAVPLFLTIRTALQRNHLWKGKKPGQAV